MEKLWQLRTQRDYQLIVLDTPPTAHALDFLDAPNRVLDFLDSDARRWLLTPALLAGKVGLRFFNLGGSYVAKTLSKLTGTETLQELANVMLALTGLADDLRLRSKEARELLGSEQTAFVLVTSPSLERMDEVIHFHTLLSQEHIDIAAIVVNRVHLSPSPEEWAQLKALP